MKNDPRHFAARFKCKCANCSTTILKGELAYYWPSSQKVFCLICGAEDFRQFLSSAADEDVYHGCGNPYAC